MTTHRRTERRPLTAQEAAVAKRLNVRLALMEQKPPEPGSRWVLSVSGETCPVCGARTWNLLVRRPDEPGEGLAGEGGASDHIEGERCPRGCFSVTF